MPRLDPPTLLTVSFVTTFLVGTLFLLSWRQAPAVRALALWGVAHLAGSLASAGLALRGLIPDLVSIGAANAVMLAAYGLIWSGVRVFEGRAARPGIALSGAALWCALCLVPAFYGSIAARIAFASAAAGLFCCASAYEIWRGRGERLASRWPAFGLLALYGACYLVRIPASVIAPVPGDRPPLDSPWVTILCLAAMLFSIACAFTFMGLIKERAEREQRLAARTDPLTGVCNRRAFVEGAEAVLAARGRGALLLFDLDRFKAINDTHGHAVGDAVLVGFCTVAAALLPPGTLLGRLGGEEFACLLAAASPAEAHARADQVRRTFAALGVPQLPDLRLGVSVGVAEIREGCGFDGLMQRADAALYAAKANGRDRVEMAAPALVRVA
ncbi:GGDEF domain-containing protein [Methylobacterium sp. NEAU 140]|uniref:GGDEF domain-containing protein n=1 Tax=Methylobacterium sp. NEAU 140 TaxID=3064945 RepID=UPI002733C87F|nr:GGDEF domain-containing protein [Methylobacterium sp. NEAU 140]MDP4022638.1 GGDEF domain-containing protein [Methylobacterium sp. NEAU 140]